MVDNGHLVAWADTVSYSVGMASNSLFGTVASGEGLMCTFTGPGPVWIQTHKVKQTEGAKVKQQAGASNIIGACIVFFIFMVFFGMVVLALVFGSSSEIPERRGSRRYLDTEF